MHGFNKRRKNKDVEKEIQEEVIVSTSEEETDDNSYINEGGHVEVDNEEE